MARLSTPLPKVCSAFALVLILNTSFVLPAPVIAATGIEVKSQSAQPSFPNSIDFHLEAASSSKITQVALLYRVGTSPIERMAYPKFEPGSAISAQYTLDTQENYLPPGVWVEYYWTLQDESGETLQTAPVRFSYEDTRFQWHSLQKGLISVYWYSGSDQFGQMVLDSATRTADRLQQEIGASTQENIKLLVYASQDQLFGALPAFSADWIGGQAYPSLNLILLTIAPGTDAASEVKRMVPHEVTHIIFGQATENPYNSPPAWLDEGLATYMQEQSDSRFSSELQQAAESGNLIPIRALNSSFPLDENRALLSYAESASVVDYLIKTFGRSKIENLMARFRDGVTYEKALQGAFGLGLDELDKQWRASLPYPQPQVTAITQTPATTPTAARTPTESAQVSPTPAAQNSSAQSSFTPTILYWIGLVGGIVVVLLVIRSRFRPH
ncbi:MAG: peptidase MA family metallohydrolase [Chloroflexi bacterium]|nr:peptidase MA family metallohydrolase [Chloroflexota bacterium]